MSQANVELVKSVHPPSGTNLSGLFNQDAESGRFQRLASLLTPDFEAMGGDLRGGRGLGPRGHGFEGLLAGWRDWLRPWETYWTEVEEFIDAGEDRVVVLVRDRGRLRGSDSEVEAIGASIWTLREGKIARIEFYADRKDALEAAGVAG
jgi:ketosteroid isomerase-like protein